MQLEFYALQTNEGNSGIFYNHIMLPENSYKQVDKKYIRQ